MIIASPGNGFVESGDWLNTIVYFNGKICNNVVYADNLVGCIIRFALDDTEQVIYECPTRAMLEVFHGAVSFGSKEVK